MKFLFKHIRLFILLLLIVWMSACKKFLDESPDKKLAIPTTLNDCRAMLGYTPFMGTDASYAEVSADNYYNTQADHNALIYEGMRRAYTWQPDQIFDVPDNDWARLYRKVYVSNVVLATLQKIPVEASNEREWKTLKGESLFIRAKCFAQLVDLWSLVYDEANASTLPGIPLRLTDDFNETSVRSTMQQTYDQLLADYHASLLLLPPLPLHIVQPSKAAGYALLSRAYLAMRNYPEALKYADSSLQLKNTLLNYNTVAINQTFSFRQFNVEQLYYTTASSGHLINSRARVDSTLYNMYAADDCRKQLFFRQHADGSFLFKGSYTGGSSQFAGIATDEVYLTRAECYARQGNTAAALADLNELLRNRIKTATFIPVTAATAEDALQKIITERRKELLMRFVRWMDIKRFNKDGAGIVMKRKINNQEYILPPNDLRYALPVPDDIIRISGMQQNPR